MKIHLVRIQLRAVFLIFIFVHLYTIVYICALKPDIVPFVSRLPVRACSLPSIGTAAVSFCIPEPTPAPAMHQCSNRIRGLDENPGKHHYHHVHYPSLYHCLSTCMYTLQVCWHLLTLYMYICIMNYYDKY